MSGYTPAGFNGDEERDWATDPNAPKASLRTKEQFLGLTCSEILNLRGADLDAACALLCMDDVTWDEEDRIWMRSNGGIFRPSSHLSHAALACDAMIKRGWNKLVIEKDRFWFAAMADRERHLITVTPLMETEAEARTMACVLAAWKEFRPLGRDSLCP